MRGEKRKLSFGEALLYVIITLIVILCTYPFLNVLACSVSGKAAVLGGKVTFYPIDFQLDSYREIFKQQSIWLSMRVSFVVTLSGTALGLALTIAAAYALSKEKLKGRKIISGFLLFTMYFGGGIIPTFIVVHGLGMYDTYAALVVPSAMSVFNFIVMRTFFRELPKELEEAALIDGAGDMKVLFQIALPLSVPIIATIGLFYAVGYWNDYFSSLIYIQSGEKFSLQLRLRQMLFANELNQASMAAEGMGTQAMPESLKMATIVFATLPIIVVYPWLQKYFVKGVMLGSVKG
ncbi:carbohydrate ABC transporter permease [Acetatifactor muris]|uniref:Inner membrane ABC transporter permease protein YcjP n=1 Tax=Acetatifactor muris TaxID=879566 RepID=A0A2K4ZGG5_9FIRM|nr:carbohydrate ABC transporter permease [Acetatifactor muris]MCR2045789.1 carbohydrate ABC transporter permease [Acetatifactor muris]SOY29526.1 Inner membrane ABC transporter permease protein YcjP [Acetatifactor muris]